MKLHTTPKKKKIKEEILYIFHILIKQKIQASYRISWILSDLSWSVTLLFRHLYTKIYKNLLYFLHTYTQMSAHSYGIHTHNILTMNEHKHC